ncbi:uncharacterized protein LOC131232730 [Magnolia sinica]|uniref:uncharacterized protein LOC131232730 n=1 Tax=Magnolia sinica TaxID=86752 RepID=UPI00265AB9E9|nr:uncharacterized protein LOC131232730 [Magnolia sinica]
MGNCFILLRPTIPKGHDHILRVMKTDEKILEYRVPILVKDLLLNFDGYQIGISRKSTQYLPLDYELRLGQMYYLLPSVDDEQKSLPTDDVCSGGSKRIKVIITKQQLQELLSKKVSLEDVLSDFQRGDSVDSMESWRPKLETIPEGNEYS